MGRALLPLMLPLFLTACSDMPARRPAQSFSANAQNCDEDESTCVRPRRREVRGDEAEAQFANLQHEIIEGSHIDPYGGEIVRVLRRSDRVTCVKTIHRERAGESEPSRTDFVCRTKN